MIMTSEIEKTLDVPSATFGYVMREMLRFVFFIPQRHLDLAPAAVEAFQRLIDLFPPPALTSFAIESGDWLTFSRQGLKDQIRERLVGPGQAINTHASLAGDQANIPDFAVDYLGRAIDRPVFRAAVSSFWFSVAVSAFAPYRDATLKLSRELVELMGCSAAYVDLALEGDRAKMQTTARRFVNLDISDVTGVARDLEGKLPGIFWQNFVGPSLASALGGASALAAILSRDARIEPAAGGGLFITLGTQPTRGDVNHREAIDDRIALARHADTRHLLHVPGKVTYFEPEGELSGKEAQERWHRRFVNAPS